MSAFAFELRADRGPYFVEVIDDGRTCYAYLYDESLTTGDRIVGDVWIYNVADSPRVAPWQLPGAGPDAMPFANPDALVRDDIARPIVDVTGENLSSDWSWTADGELGHVDVVIDTVTWARLAPGAKPGWARLAAYEGPCAKVLP